MKRLKIGVFGGGRGATLAQNFKLLNCDIVALCDNRKERIDWAMEKLNDQSIAIYDDFDEFLKHNMDAVIIANFFHEHSKYAIKCMEKGIHIFCECISNGTMAEGVELLRAAEKSSSIYFLAENYPQMIFNREIKRVCDTKTLGKILYAEGEYNHPGNPYNTGFRKRYNYFEEHWRNYLPRTYYITHSLGPIMHATGATPIKVTAFASFAPVKEDAPSAARGGDRVAVVTTQNDDGSIFRVTGCAGFGAHHNSYRVCGTEGQIENLRGTNKVMLRYNSWSIPEGLEEINMYEPQWNDKDEELIKTSDHDGADFVTARMFIDCIRTGKQPEHPFDIYSAVNMSSVAILSHRSMLEGGVPYDIPDFRKEESRKQYENDRLSPFYSGDGSKPNIPCCSNTTYVPTEKQIELYKKSLEEE
ncbi:MAG: Gfo/Idh/MocA family oxidoreductase [Ruminococcaceae bacterium]|nr:Gfo/Idh/MocA family oxidoreductase [Oscillospiraceae bacterium]